MFIGNSPEERELLGEELGWNPFSKAWSAAKAAGRSVKRFVANEITNRAKIFIGIAMPPGARGRRAHPEKFVATLARREYWGGLRNRWVWKNVSNFEAPTRDEAIAKATADAKARGLVVIGVDHAKKGLVFA